MSRAVGRDSVPLKNMCSEKWAIPFVSRVSYREPAASMIMQVTEVACGIGAGARGARCRACDVRRCSRDDGRQLLAPVFRQGDRLATSVVVGDLDALGLGDGLAVDSQL